MGLTSFKASSVVVLGLSLAGCNHTAQPQRVGMGLGLGCNSIEQMTCQNASLSSVREMCANRARACGW